LKTLVNVTQTTEKLTARFLTKESSGKWVHKHVDFSEARAAVVMPVSEHPGYFLIMGRETYPSPSGRNPLRFMMEGEEVLHDVLFQKLTDACRKCRSMTLYAKQERTTMGMEGSYRELWQYIRKNQIGGIRLMPAPSSNDPEYGKTIVLEYIKSEALHVPRGTILRPKLADMNKLQTLDESFYAFHALRYVAAGFSKSKHMPLPFMTGSNASIDRKNAKGWT